MFWPGLSTSNQRCGEHGCYLIPDSFTYLLRDKCMKVNVNIGGYLTCCEELRTIIILLLPTTFTEVNVVK